MAKSSVQKRVIRGIIAFIGFALFFLTLAYAPFPGGAAGVVLRNNQAKGIDATPLIYSDLENYNEIEKGLWQMKQAANAAKHNSAGKTSD